MLKPWGEHTTWMDFTPVGGNGQPTWESTQYLNTDTGIYRWTTLSSVMVGGGVQADDVEAMSGVDAVFTMPKPVQSPFVLGPAGYYTVGKLAGYSTTYQAPAWDPVTGDSIDKPAPELLTVDLTKAVQAWVDGQANYGWFFEPTSSDGWDFETAEGKQPPALIVEVAGAPLAQ
jgi:hypothetical protein